MASIREEGVLHVAKLARLRLAPGEAGLYQEQLGRVLEHIEELSSLDLSGVPETFSVLGPGAPPREDVAAPYAGAASLLENAPASEDGFFKVPKVIG